MKRKDFIDLLEKMDNETFNAELSSLAYKLNLGLPLPDWKLSALKNESEKRNIDFDKLLAVKSPALQSNYSMNYSVKSLDQLDESEISALKSQISKRQRSRIDSDKLNTSTLPMFFGIDAKNMIIATVKGDSMTGFGLKEGDLVVIDSSLTPKTGEIILVRVENEVFIKKLEIEKGFITLHSGNDKYNKVRISSDRNYEILGVMRYHIKSADN